MNKIIKTKQGAASIYIVVFTILLFSIITIAFAFLISSESNKTQNDTLAQAAYDSSLAGIEDAKLAVIKYRNCLDDIGDNCENIKSLFEEGMANKDCDMVAKVLGRRGAEGGEVFITETIDGGTESAMDQAYTCVVLNSILSDYRASISSTSSNKVIPLQVSEKEGPDGTTKNIDDVDSVTISWYSKENKGAATPVYTEVSHNEITHKPEFKFVAADDPEGIIAPPILSVSFVQFPYSGVAIGANSKGNDDTDSMEKSNFGQVWLVPVDSDLNDCSTAPSISGVQCLVERQKNYGDSNNVFAYSNFHKDENYNDPYAVKCDEDNDFLCSATIKIPKSYLADGIDLDGVARDRLNGYCYLVVSLPYNRPDTSIKVEMKDSDGNTINFGEAQIAIDSTGRASDVYARTEARVELADTNFPYPYYALQAFGNNEDNMAISKNFWASQNCWYTSYDAGTKQNKVFTCDGNEVY